MDPANTGRKFGRSIAWLTLLACLAGCGDPGFQSRDIGAVSTSDGMFVYFYVCKGEPVQKVLVGAGTDMWGEPTWTLIPKEPLTGFFEIELSDPEGADFEVAEGGRQSLAQLKPPYFVRVISAAGESPGAFNGKSRNGGVETVLDDAIGGDTTFIPMATFKSRWKEDCQGH